VIMMCMWYVSLPACITEHIGVGASMSRSRFLTRGYRWQVLGTNLLIGTVGASLLVFIPSTPSGIAQGGGQVWQFSSYAIVDALYGVVACVFYYELRLAKEGVDLKIAGVFD